MKKTLTHATLLSAWIFLATCAQNGAESPAAGTAGKTAHTTISEEPPADAPLEVSKPAPEGIPGLVLNEGRRWQMDDHTRTVFARMAASFAAIEPDSASSDDLQAAGVALQEDIGALIQGCTMTGPAHDQLHVYLTSYIPAVAALAGSGSVEDAQKVRHYLQGYDQYFE